MRLARAVLVPAGQPNGQLRFGLLLCLDRTRSIGCQVAIAFLVGLCQFEFGIVHRNGCLRLADRGFLLRHTRGMPRDAGLGGGDLCRSEEHTSELQSLMRTSYAVFCLKKKN